VVNAQRARKERKMKTTQTMEQTVAALKRLTTGQLRDRYLGVFGERTRSGNKDFLFKRIAWRLQCQAEGGLSERAKRRAQELARDADLRTTVPKTTEPKGDGGGKRVAGRLSVHDRLPIPGTVLTRKYRGNQVSVKVLTDGFEYEHETYRSLSAVAKAVTGSHWNGLLFFGLATKGSQ
jgi:hypothetical protein